MMSNLVSRFRSSHHCAAHSFANFGIKGTLALYDSSAVFGFEVPTQTRGYNDRNFKSTALVELDISAVSQNLGPAFGLAADECCELGRRVAADREDARLFQSGDHGGVAIHARDLAMDVVDDGGRGAGGSHQGDPGGAFVESGQVGGCAEAWEGGQRLAGPGAV